MGEEIPLTEEKPNNHILSCCAVFLNYFWVAKKIKPNIGILIEYIRHFAKQ